MESTPKINTNETYKMQWSLSTSEDKVSLLNGKHTTCLHSSNSSFLLAILFFVVETKDVFLAEHPVIKQDEIDINVKSETKTTFEFEYACESSLKTHHEEVPLESNETKFITRLGVHRAQQSFHCNVCDSKFGRKSSLTRHMLIHTGEKPFECNICNYKCTVKGYLQTHMRVHSSEKPFECNLCSYKSAVRGNLRTHMLVHSGEKPFVCNICDYKCKAKVSLQRHTMRVHVNK